MSKPIEMSRVKQIIRQYCAHVPKKAIARRHLGISLKTVKTYLKLVERQDVDYTNLLAMSDEELDLYSINFKVSRLTFVH